VKSYHILIPVYGVFGFNLTLNEKREMLDLPKKQEPMRESFRIDRFQKRVDDFYPEHKYWFSYDITRNSKEPLIGIAFIACYSPFALTISSSTFL
jgi:hypothetical protein